VVNVTAGSLSLTNDALLSSSTFGQGDAGSVSVQADSVSLANSNIFSTVGNTGVGNAGVVNVTAGSLSLTNDALLSYSTFGQ
ncbi:hypothetical protein, partial [Rosenbergiella epipactidis]|uniref:hypothetical protein n=1 Tax=Rosenbergiella epipactidis TaxID=1544694 RepID=UPI001F4D51C9